MATQKRPPGSIPRYVCRSTAFEQEGKHKGIMAKEENTTSDSPSVALPDAPEMKGNRKRNMLLARKKRMSGYRSRALQSGVDKNTLELRIFSNADVKRMMRFCPPEDALSYTEDEFQRRRMLSATPVPPTAAQAMGPAIDALAKRICDTAARAAYVAGRPSMQPYDILNASRGVLSVSDFSVMGTDGLARFAQTHDARGKPVSEREEGEDARLPMMDFLEGDIDHEMEDARAIRSYTEISGAVDRWLDAKKKKKKEKTPVVEGKGDSNALESDSSSGASK